MLKANQLQHRDGRVAFLADTRISPAVRGAPASFVAVDVLGNGCTKSQYSIEYWSLRNITAVGPGVLLPIEKQGVEQ